MNILKVLKSVCLTLLLHCSALLFSQNSKVEAPPCNCTINAGPDKDLCKPGGSVILNGSYTGTPVSFEWLPTPGLDDYTILNPEATVTATTNFTFSLRCKTNNFFNIPNHDFSGGNTGFYNDYAYVGMPGAPFTAGNYTVTNDPSLFNPAFSSCGDHTTGTGNMLLIDGSTTAGEDIWCQDYVLVPNQEYVFTFWVALAYPQSPPEIQVTCNGIVVGLVYVEDDPTCQWTKYTVYFNPGSNNVVDMCMQDLNDDGVGNDFLIDDIEMEEICRITDYTTVYVHPNKTNSIAASICEGQAYKYNNQNYYDAGEYDIPFKTWKNCDSIVTLILDVIDVKAEIDVPQLISCKNSSVTLNGGNSSFGTGYSYLWTTTDGKLDTDPKQPEVKVSKTGTYTLTVTYFLNGLKCEKSTTTQVFSDFSLPVINAGKDTIISCGDTVLSLKGIVQTPANGYSVNWTTLDGKIKSKSDTISPLISTGGTYIFTVSNNITGCIQTDTVLVGQDSSLPKSIVTGDQLLTCTIDSIWLDGTNSDKGKPYTFTWSTSDGNFISKTDSLKVLIDKPGEYLLTIQDTVLGCKAISSIKILNDLNTPTVDGGLPDTLSCNITQLILNGSSSLPDSISDIKWNSINGIIVSGANTLTPTIKKAGSYFITVQNTINGCSALDSVLVVNDINLPNAYIGPDDTLNCIQSIVNIESLGINTSPNLDYLWSTVNGNILGPNNSLAIQGDKTGLYILKITNTLSGCISSDTLEVLLDKQAPVVSITPPNKLTCIDIEVDLDATNSSSGSNFNYLWSTQNGNISGPDNLKLSSADIPGIYYLIITNTQNGCVNMDSIEVLQDIAPPDMFIKDPGPIICKNLTPLLEANSKVNPIPLNFLWSTSNGSFNGNATSPSIELNAPGTYYLQSTSVMNGCIDIDTIIIGIDTIKPIAIAPNDTFVNCCQYFIDVVGDYQHTKNDVSVAYKKHPNTSPLGLMTNGLNAKIYPSGTFILYVTDTISGCVGTDTFNVLNNRIPPDANIINTTELNCIDSIGTLNLSQTNNNWSYQWNTLNGNITGNNTASFIDINSGGAYTVEVKDIISCCITNDTVQVLEDKIPPIIDAGSDEVIGCIDTLAVLNGSIISSSGTTLVSWVGNNGQTITLPNSLNPTVEEAGTYFISVTDEKNGCIAIDSIKVSVNNTGPTELKTDLINTGCGELGSINILNVIGGTAPYLYSINGNSFQANSSFNDLAAGNYTIDIKDSNGCLYSEEVVITDNPVGSLQLPSDLTIQPGDSVQLVPVLNGLSIQDIDSILWSPETGLSCFQCLSPFAFPSTNQLYTLVLFDKSGCKLSGSVNISLNSTTNIFIPNIFSPNGDGINDTWKIFADSKIVKRINHIAIFDRWGNNLWESNDVTDLSNYIGWDGKAKGKRLNNGVFVYYAEIELLDGTKRLYKGDITLSR